MYIEIMHTLPKVVICSKIASNLLGFQVQIACHYHKLTKISDMKMKSQLGFNYRYHIGWLPSQGNIDSNLSRRLFIQKLHQCPFPPLMQLSIKKSDGCTNEKHDNTIPDLGSIYPLLIVLNFTF
jgi:hypothetical protein